MTLSIEIARKPICPVCSEPIEEADEAPCKHCETDVHEGCLADYGICKGCADEIEDE